MSKLPVPSPKLEDDVVHLLPWSLEDVGLRVQAGFDPDILKFTSVSERPTVREAKDWIQRRRQELDRSETAFFVITSSVNGAQAGSMGLMKIDWPNLRAEIGYWLLPAFRGAGLARHGLELISRWSFEEVGLERLELLTNLDNLGSRRVAHSCGYIHEGTLRSYAYGRHGRENLHMYSRLPAD